MYRAPKILERNSQGSSLRKKQKRIVKVSFVEAAAAAALLIIKSVFCFFSILWRLLGSRDLVFFIPLASPNGDSLTTSMDKRFSPKKVVITI